jgi:hypothetical protein
MEDGLYTTTESALHFLENILLNIEERKNVVTKSSFQTSVF